MSSYFSSVKKQFHYYKLLGERTFAQLDEEDIHWRPDPEANSIAIIVGHLHGNMMSRWTNFLTEDGEKPWRKREQEFEPIIQNKEELRTKWEEGWSTLFGAIDPLVEDDLERIIYIRNQGHTVTEAINRQLSHYPMHIGQIVYIGRMRKGTAWQSLSIPRGGTAAFNAKK
ncbi:MAG: DUF1572 family protein, partial [Bacteroidota bacterium]